MCRNVYETPWDALCVPGSFGHRGASHEVAGRTAGHGSEGPDKEQRGIHSTVRPAAVPEIEPEGGRLPLEAKTQEGDSWKCRRQGNAAAIR